MADDDNILQQKENDPNHSHSFLNQIIKTQSLLTAAEFNLNAFMQLVAEQMHKLTPATGAVVELVDGADMVYSAATGTVSPYVGLRLPIKNSISGLCVTQNQVLCSDDTEKDSRVNLEACRKVSARSMVVTPLVYQGNTVGVLKIVSKEPNAFTDTDVQTLQLMAGFIASGLAHQLSFETKNQMLLERTKMLNQLQISQDRLYRLAHYDALTNLANRRTFIESLTLNMKKAKLKSTLLGLMYLDIDHFKSINDNLGHDIGDELLVAFAGRLSRCVRKNDLVARLGGDEFVIILNELDKKTQAFAVAEKIIGVMAEKFKFKTQSLNITTSIGITFYTDQKISEDELIKQADTALYMSKEAGKNTFRVFEKK